LLSKSVRKENKAYVLFVIQLCNTEESQSGLSAPHYSQMSPAITISKLSSMNTSLQFYIWEIPFAAVRTKKNNHRWRVFWKKGRNIPWLRRRLRPRHI